ncbi:hypothetical protein [Microbacterium sp. 10M-3C3]|uniref:hypothetical protein n=1 Tax=Microbacterium sp. 10M-3C3 TaxID=2483401 RepID=UPI000F63AB73|nr:hypothetical protein [Microbacterium sp. 10M-3C3]
MQILLGILFGTAVGIAVHFAVPARPTRGVALLPLIGAAVGAVVWTALTWAGWGADNPLLWLSAIVLPAVVTVPVGIALSSVRARRDAAVQARLRTR